MPRIMIIRHAEKHRDGGIDRGVSIDGVHAKHELTVRGWQRAAALVRYFAPLGGHPVGAPISVPRSVIASAATEESPSLRAQHTVKLLADTLGLRIDAAHPDGDEVAAADTALAAPSPVLIAWHHNHIGRLARLIAGGELDCPDHWPDERFDVVWTLDGDVRDGWRLTQVPQCLFPYDLPHGF